MNFPSQLSFIVNDKTMQIKLTHTKLGEGQFGWVQLGYDMNDKKTYYAVKQMKRKEMIKEDPRLLQCLQREIECQSSIQNPYVARLYGSLEYENNFYLLLEYCNGGTLSRFMKARGGYLKEKEARLFMSQIVEGMAALHDKNIIHRDLKPDNLLVEIECKNDSFSNNFMKDFEISSTNIRVKLADFGFSKTLEQDELTGTRCGSPLFMAPEIIKYKKYSHNSDVWSLGCIFYEMIFGVVPFYATETHVLFQKLDAGWFVLPMIS